MTSLFTNRLMKAAHTAGQAAFRRGWTQVGYDEKSRVLVTRICQPQMAPAKDTEAGYMKIPQGPIDRRVKVELVFFVARAPFGYPCG